MEGQRRTKIRRPLGVWDQVSFLLLALICHDFCSKGDTIFLVTLHLLSFLCTIFYFCFFLFFWWYPNVNVCSDGYCHLPLVCENVLMFGAPCWDAAIALKTGQKKGKLDILMFITIDIYVCHAFVKMIRKCQ